MGGIRRARAYAKRLGASLAIIDKRRPTANKAEVINVVGRVKGKEVLIVDDIIDTAGTLMAAVRILEKRGREISMLVALILFFQGMLMRGLKIPS